MIDDADEVRIERAALGLDRRERTRRFGRWGLAGSGIALVASTALVTWTNNGAPCLVGLLTPLTALGSLVMLAVGVFGSLPTLRAGTLSIRGGTLSAQRVDGTLARSLPIASIVQGWAEEPDRVHLALADGEVLVVRVPEAELRARVLRAVGATVAERVLRVPLPSASSQLVGGTLLVLLVLAAVLGLFFLAASVVAVALGEARTGPHPDTAALLVPGVLGIALTGLAAYALLSLLQRRELVIGADGITFRRVLARKLIPYAEVTRVALDPRGLCLHLRDGARVTLPTLVALQPALPVDDVDDVAPLNEGDVKRRALLLRIEEAMALGTGAAAPRLTQLDRGERSIAEWRAALLRLAGAAEHYRSRPLSSADLAAVVEDPTAPAERRIAAAVALSAREPETAKRRVRIAAQASADEALAGALERAAEGEIIEAVIARAPARRAPDPQRG
jgi:hypothetical protein